MQYTVLIHPAPEGGFWAEAPALPGCLSQGESIEETLDNISEALAAHLEGLRVEGKEIPKDAVVVVVRIRV